MPIHGNLAAKHGSSHSLKLISFIFQQAEIFYDLAISTLSQFMEYNDLSIIGNNRMGIC